MDKSTMEGLRELSKMYLKAAERTDEKVWEKETAHDAQLYLEYRSLTGLVLSADISASNRLTERNSEGSLKVGRRFKFG